MAVAFVQRKAGAATAASVAITFDAAPIVGNKILVLIGASSGSDNLTCTDNSGGANTYTKVTRYEEFVSTAVFECELASDAGGTLTITVGSVGSGGVAGIITEFSGVLDASSFDVAAADGGLSGAPNPGTTAATAQADEVAVAFFFNTNGTLAGSAPNSYTSLGGAEATNALIVGGRLILAAIGTQNETFTQDGTVWGAHIATFKGAAAAPITDAPEVLRTVTARRW